MTKYRKKPVLVDAVQWLKSGDHPAARSWFNRPEVYWMEGPEICEHCGIMLRKHGCIGDSKGWYTVCPGDWIVTDSKGERYPCKPDTFELTYTEV